MGLHAELFPRVLLTLIVRNWLFFNFMIASVIKNSSIAILYIKQIRTKCLIDFKVFDATLRIRLN